MSTGLFGGNKMKVLQVNTVCGTGSTGRIAADIHKMLIEQGHESVVAYGRGN
ncbi:MAG: putative colanic acid biosynthesis glycosyltransferase [Petrotoga sp.]|nr:putative colanic acid biosynthesis glycosyltransferase [Petrotoga sp.]